MTSPSQLLCTIGLYFNVVLPCLPRRSQLDGAPLLRQQFLVASNVFEHLLSEGGGGGGGGRNTLDSTCRSQVT